MFCSCASTAIVFCFVLPTLLYEFIYSHFSPYPILHFFGFFSLHVCCVLPPLFWCLRSFYHILFCSWHGGDERSVGRGRGRWGSSVWGRRWLRRAPRHRTHHRQPCFVYMSNCIWGHDVVGCLFVSGAKIPNSGEIHFPSSSDSLVG